MSLLDSPDYSQPTKGGSHQLLNTTTGPIANGAEYTSPVLAVSNFAQVVCWLGLTNSGPTQWFIQPCVDAAGTTNLPGQIQKNDNLPPGPGPVLIGVVAPFMVITALNFSGLTRNYNVFAYGTLVGLTPAQVLGSFPIANINVSVGAGLTNTSGPNISVPGQSILSLSADTQPAKVVVSVWNGAAYQPVGGLTVVAGQTNQTFIALPPGEMKLAVTNTGAGAANVSASVIPF